MKNAKQSFLTRMISRMNWLVFLVIVIAAGGLFTARLVVGDAMKATDFAAIAGTILTLGYFVIQEDREKTRFFHDLFRQFNERYDKINDKLQASLASDESFDEDKHKRLQFIDYFNLCAEEHLFYHKGYIPQEVWNAWYKGMEVYGKDKRVSAIWIKEIRSQDSEDLTLYYGFRFPAMIREN